MTGGRPRTGGARGGRGGGRGGYARAGEGWGRRPGAFAAAERGPFGAGHGERVRAAARAVRGTGAQGSGGRAGTLVHRRRGGVGRADPPPAVVAGRERHRRAAAHQPRPCAAGLPSSGPGGERGARPHQRRARVAPGGRRRPVRHARRGGRGDGGEQQRGRGHARARRAGSRAPGARQPWRERGDRRRLPRARGDGAVGGSTRGRRHHEPHPPRGLLQSAGPAQRRRGPGVEGAPEQLPRRGVRRGHVGRGAGHPAGTRGGGHRQRPGGCHLPVAEWPSPGLAGGRTRGSADAGRGRGAGDVQRRQAVGRPAGRHHRRPQRPRGRLPAPSAGPRPAAGGACAAGVAGRGAGLPRAHRRRTHPLLAHGRRTTARAARPSRGHRGRCR